MESNNDNSGDSDPQNQPQNEMGVPSPNMENNTGHEPEKTPTTPDTGKDTNDQLNTDTPSTGTEPLSDEDDKGGEEEPVITPKQPEQDPTPEFDTDELEKIKQKNSSLQHEITQLKQDRADLENQIEEKQSKINELNQKIDQLESDQDKIKELQDRIDGLQGTKEAQLREINDLHEQVKSLQGELDGTKSSQSGIKQLQEEVKVLRILASTESQALEMYNVLKGYQSLNMRKLAMQSGLSAQACKKLIEGLERAGLVRVERAGADDTDPKVSLVN